MAEFADRRWSSRDGLRLHYRDYPGDAALARVRDVRGQQFEFAGISRRSGQARLRARAQ